METKKLKWIEGEGYITATYSGSGNDSVVLSSDVNEDIDREQTITVSTTNGDNPKDVCVNVKQYGLREVFLPLDGDFIMADNCTYNVLKPKPYTEIEYIESDGSKYIDTGFVPNQDTRVVIDFEIVDRDDSASGVIGCKFDYSTMFSLRVRKADDTFVSDYGESYSKAITVIADGRFIVDKNKGITTINNKKLTQTSSDFTSLSTMLIFAMYGSNGSLYGCVGKIYSCKIYDNDILVRDYIPATWSDGKNGLYDNFNKTFTPLSNL